jgi:UDP:flavonoid glycosyltransferase YjiC (YdhE family)
MVAIPVGNDQPGVAARVKWLGAGEVLPLKRLRADRLRTLVKKVLEEERYRLHARRLMSEIKRADGVLKAADLIEQVLNQQRPLLRATAVQSASGLRSSLDIS